MVTKHLALRIEQSEIDYMTSWMRALGAMGGNPFVVTVHENGTTVALMDATASLGPLMNRILGFDEDALSQMPDLLRLYNDRRTGCRFDINPYRGSPRVYRAFADAGLVPLRFHSALYLQPDRGMPMAARPMPRNVTVERIAADQQAEWASVWLDSFTEVMGMSPNVGARLASATARLCDVPGWALFLARVDDQPAACAALYLQGGMATLCLAGTVTAFRGRGCQTALLDARIRYALEQEFDLLVSQSALGSTSQNNMERAGLRVAYTRAFWWKEYGAAIVR